MITKSSAEERESILGSDTVSVEVMKKALVWYYRLWSFYWQQRPTCCVIHPAESFLEFSDEVICFRQSETTAQDAARLRVSFAQPISFISASVPPGESGFQLNVGPQKPSKALDRFMKRIGTQFGELSEEVKSVRTQERSRQEWRFAEAGIYAIHLDGKTKRICLEPERGSPYTFTVIKSTTDGLYFTESKKGPLGGIVEQGAYRRHRHESGKQIADNLDFFPERGEPALWRFVQAGRGFKAFTRNIPAAIVNSLRAEC